VINARDVRRGSGLSELIVERDDDETKVGSNLFKMIRTVMGPNTCSPPDLKD